MHITESQIHNIATRVYVINQLYNLPDEKTSFPLQQKVSA